MQFKSIRAEVSDLDSKAGIVTAYWSAFGNADSDGLIWRSLQPGGAWEYWEKGAPFDEFTKLGKEAEVSLDQAQRLKNFQRMDELINDMVPWIPLYQPYYFWAMHKSLEYQASPYNRVDLRNVNLRFTA